MLKNKIFTWMTLGEYLCYNMVQRGFFYGKLS